jgi:hypothetical protein
VAWCLGIEPIFGLPDNDASCFSEAARDEFEVPNKPPARVLHSECSVSLSDRKARRIRLTRAIQGDRRTVQVEEIQGDTIVRTSKLTARSKTMQDEHGGLQRFLFEWLKWPREEVSTFRGAPAEVYLENLAPAFYIDQSEGWTNVQALQISRYGQQEIAEIAVEYLLGATDAIKARVFQQQAEQRSAYLHGTARAIADRVASTLLRRGWNVEWSGKGTLVEIIARWSSRPLKEVLKAEANEGIN